LLPCILAAALLLLPAGAASPARDSRRETALRHFRAAWGRFHLSVALPRAALIKPSDQITMRQQAIREMLRAVALAPREEEFLESLGYLYAQNQQPRQAETWYQRAVKAAPRQPRLRYLLARLYAARVVPGESGAAQASRQADKAYSAALNLDRANGLLLLEAAYTLHRAGLDTLARQRLQRALYRSRYRLYTLPAPTDLTIEEGNPAAAWFALQQRFWSTALARAHEVARWCLTLGSQAEKQGNLGAAQAHYQHAVSIGQSVARIEPRTVAAALVGLTCQEAGLEALVRLEKKRHHPTAASAASARLKQVRRAKQAALDELVGAANPSATSVKALLERQAHTVRRILALAEHSP